MLKNDQKIRATAFVTQKTDSLELTKKSNDLKIASKKEYKYTKKDFERTFRKK